MPMTNDELAGIAAQGIGMARTDYDKGNFNFLVAVYKSPGPLYRMKKVEELIVKILGESWLNSGAAKDAGFSVIREACERMPPEAVVFVTACNRFEGTEKFRALPEAEREKHMNRGHDHHHRLVKEGLLVLHDSFTAFAQTPQTVCVFTQDVDHGKPSAKPEIKFSEQANFGGRLKMFGSKE